MPPAQGPQPPAPRASFGLLFVRHGIPALIAVVGVIGIILGHGTKGAAGAGVVLLGVALMVWLLGWLFRLSLSSNRDRDREEEARDYYSKHGHWPGEGAG
jgi:hypothetical protein